MSIIKPTKEQVVGESQAVIPGAEDVGGGGERNLAIGPATELDGQPKSTVPEVASAIYEKSGETAYHDISDKDAAIEVDNISLWYGDKQALTGVSLNIPRKKITAIIGPSGCGKSTLLRCINRMNDLVGTVRISGELRVDGVDVYGKNVDPVEVRRRVGMVFQKPNPFPRSIRDNILYGAKINGYRGNHDELVRHSLEQAALWDEVKNDLKKSGLALSGGQQQRLCIARAIAIAPDVLLMDEPASALDPIATLKIEDLMQELVQNYTIVVVTHNMQQAARVSQYTAFMLSDEKIKGQLVEFGETQQIFTNPRDKRTEDYITGRFG